MEVDRTMKKKNLTSEDALIRHIYVYMYIYIYIYIWRLNTSNRWTTGKQIDV
jgi:hypothetical protein